MSNTDRLIDLEPTRLKHGYRAGKFTPLEIMSAALDCISADTNSAVWIHLIPRGEILERAKVLSDWLAHDNTVIERLPLLGVPFAVKDNIDVANTPTTAACPAFSYCPTQHATVVARLLDAGAILVGKTNMDQFATGLVGTRSPHGTPRNPFDNTIVPGGSSSGSAVAVAQGLVSFSLGTDTAGSGRIPAAFNNIVGFKPTRGMFSNFGVVPACRSLDCVSIFGGSVGATLDVANVLVGYDQKDPFSRPQASGQRYQLAAIPRKLRVAIPRAEQLMFFGDVDCERAYDTALRTASQLGAELIEIDFTPFRQAGQMLYRGPWVAERALVVQRLLVEKPEAIHRDVRTALSGAHCYTAGDAFSAYHDLKELRCKVHDELGKFDCLLVPSFGRAYKIAEILDDPMETNARLGYYTNFVNLLDLCAIAVPTSFLPSQVPYGVTLIGPAFSENRLAAIADPIHRAQISHIGATPFTLPPRSEPTHLSDNMIAVCLVGAHMSGLSLNYQLIEMGAQFIRQTETASHYRLFALENMNPVRPGMTRVTDAPGRQLSVEVWSVPAKSFGMFVARVPAPLAIGAVDLADGSWVTGFVCQEYAISGARDITEFGGWRAFLDGAPGKHCPQLLDSRPS